MGMYPTTSDTKAFFAWLLAKKVTTASAFAASKWHPWCRPIIETIPAWITGTTALPKPGIWAKLPSAIATTAEVAWMMCCMWASGSEPSSVFSQISSSAADKAVTALENT
eukprot:CAMPEP_0169261748 /NCGR_PEP_ID=MMETSP1016-20121227/43283_1 /TAXON_ID=342587 /ORGANISM="Karlodinium micrum, Strain CCMP2283" /LENGTH=109 /DNA_ID=CAMNT_0009344115 /DNA_START=600 /DNA_END=929 /DNA_ORIENTATION=+